MGLWYTLKTSRIRWVNDPVPAGFATNANYKSCARDRLQNERQQAAGDAFTPIVSDCTRARIRRRSTTRSSTSRPRLRAELDASAPASTSRTARARRHDTTDDTGLVTFPGSDAKPDQRKPALLRHSSPTSLVTGCSGRTRLRAVPRPNASHPRAYTRRGVDSLEQRGTTPGHVQLSDSETPTVEPLPVQAVDHLCQPERLERHNRLHRHRLRQVGAPGPNRGPPRSTCSRPAATRSDAPATTRNLSPSRIVPATYVVGRQHLTGMTSCRRRTTISSHTTTFAPPATKAVPDNYTGGVLTSTFPLTLNYTPHPGKPARSRSRLRRHRSSCSSGSTVSG